jgi:hypothetical protein
MPAPASTHSDPDADADLEPEAAFDLLPLVPHIEQVLNTAPTARPSYSSPRAQRNVSGSYTKDGGQGDKSFGATERGLQARAMNYNLGGSGSGGREWENRQKRDEAVRVLEGGEELIMWVAAARNEVSLPFLFLSSLFPPHNHPNAFSHQFFRIRLTT